MPKQTKQRKKKSGIKTTKKVTKKVTKKPIRKLARKQKKQRTSKKKKYLVKNWKQYNESLMNRGKIFFYVSQEVLSQWNTKKEESRKRGRPQKYSNLSIEIFLFWGED